LGLADRKQRVRQGMHGSCDPIGDAGFSHQLRDGHFHRALLDPQGFADFAIEMSRDDQVQHLWFGLSEDHRILRLEVIGNGRDALDEFC